MGRQDEPIAITTARHERTRRVKNNQFSPTKTLGNMYPTIIWSGNAYGNINMYAFSIGALVLAGRCFCGSSCGWQLWVVLWCCRLLSA